MKYYSSGRQTLAWLLGIRSLRPVRDQTIAAPWQKKRVWVCWVLFRSHRCDGIWDARWCFLVHCGKQEIQNVLSRTMSCAVVVFSSSSFFFQRRHEWKIYIYVKQNEATEYNTETMRMRCKKNVDDDGSLLRTYSRYIGQ